MLFIAALQNTANISMWRWSVNKRSQIAVFPKKLEIGAVFAFSGKCGERPVKILKKKTRFAMKS